MTIGKWSDARAMFPVQFVLIDSEGLAIVMSGELIVLLADPMGRLVIEDAIFGVYQLISSGVCFL